MNFIFGLSLQLSQKKQQIKELKQLKRSYDTVQIEKDCDYAFSQFVAQYNKSYPSDADRNTAYEQFCSHLEALRSIRRQDPSIEVGINEHSDKPLRSLITGSLIRHNDDIAADSVERKEGSNVDSDDSFTREGQSINNYNRAQAVSNTSCSTRYMKYLSESLLSKSVYQIDPPLSVDLREWGTIGKALDQGSCGSCWAMTTRYVMQSSVLHDALYYRQIYSNVADAGTIFSTGNLKLSVQMILNDSTSGNAMCGGGNFENAILDSALGNIPSHEFETAVPYNSMMWADDKGDPEHIDTQTEAFKANPLIPIHYYNSNRDGCTNVLFSVDTSSKKGFDDAEVKKVKQLLSAGVVLAGQMDTDAGTNEDANKFQLYRSGVIDTAHCSKVTSNHQITLVGYGHYKATPVWLWLNSWGSSWGQYGYFMTKIGSNSFCTENQVTGIISRFTGYDSAAYDSTKPFNESSLYKQMVEDGYIYNIFNRTIHRDQNGLDGYTNGQPNNIIWKLPNGKWGLLGFGILFVILLIVAIYRCCRKTRWEYRIHMPIYIQYPIQEQVERDVKYYE